jgi:hypothetical protein
MFLLRAKSTSRYPIRFQRFFVAANITLLYLSEKFVKIYYRVSVMTFGFWLVGILAYLTGISIRASVHSAIHEILAMSAFVVGAIEKQT